MESVDNQQRHYDEIKKEYLNLSEKHLAETKDLSKKIIQSGWIRVLIFIALFVVPYFCNSISTSVALASFILLAILFGFLIKRSNKIKRCRKEAEILTLLNNNEQKAIEGDWSCFEDGTQFINPSHNYSHDLDLFGPGSFYQYINRSSTKGGELLLNKEISKPLLLTEEIQQRQEALKELSELTNFRQLFYAKGKLLKETEEDIKKISQIVSYKPILLAKRTYYKILTTVLPVLFIASLILSFAGLSATICTLLFFINLTLIGSKLKVLNKTNIVFTSLSRLLKKYAILTELVCDQEFSSQQLIKLKNNLFYKQQKASDLINKLGHYMNQFDQRNGIIGGILLNGAVLWDFIYVLKIENWLHKHKEHINWWIDSIHEMDVLQSMAGYVHNHPDYTFPKLSNSIILSAENLGHPLLDRQSRVTNNFDFKNSIFTLITGANMSGKSTFLRTVGLNLVIARCGMNVCATKMIFKPMPLVTNMRTSDSLYKHESYFYAELKRLQMIIEKLNGGNNLFIILDEILKGTNSKDKTYGSMELIKNLLSLKGYGMIATHDLELGILESQTNGKITNLCFEVEHKKDHLLFDYKLRHGITQNHNATFLMKQMGIISNNNFL